MFNRAWDQHSREDQWPHCDAGAYHDGRLGLCGIIAAARFFSCFLNENQGGSCASGTVEVVDLIQLRFEELAVGLKMRRWKGEVGVDLSKAGFRSSRQRLLSRYSVSNALRVEMTGRELTQLFKFGKAEVDAPVNKMDRVDKRLASVRSINFFDDE